MTGGHDHLEGDLLSGFMDLWSRSEELLSVLKKLPAELVLKTGQSARRNSLISQWQDLESPGLDGSIPDGASESVRAWNHCAESAIALIVNLAKDARESSSKINFQTLESIDDSSFISDAWCWPWEHKEVQSVEKWNKEKLVKFGVVAGLGLMALVTYLDED